MKKMMKNHSRTTEYCKYSFDDLFEAAFGKILNPKEKEKLQKLPQEKINALVIQWAQKAGWKTRKKKGEDSQTYLSFYP